MKLTKQEKDLIELFTNYFIGVVLNNQLKFSETADQVEVDVTEEFVKQLREIL